MDFRDYGIGLLGRGWIYLRTLFLRQMQIGPVSGLLSDLLDHIQKQDVQSANEFT